MSREPETQPSRKLCVLVHCLASTCENQTISGQARKCDHFAHFFCGCNCKTSRICHQWTRL